MFLGSGDIQLGVNETLYDSARVISSMVDGIFARVGHHSEVEVSLKASRCRTELYSLVAMDTDPRRSLYRSSHQRSLSPLPSNTNPRRLASSPRSSTTLHYRSLISQRPHDLMGRRFEQHPKRNDGHLPSNGNQPSNRYSERLRSRSGSVGSSECGNQS